MPYPPESLRKHESKRGKGSSGGATRLPYTQVFLAAMRYGYSRRDLAEMPYGEVIFDLAAMNEDVQREEVAEDVSMATQDDIRSMLG